MNPVSEFYRDYFNNRLDNRLPTRLKNPDIVEYAEKTIIATGVYRGLKFSHDRAPYLKRPMWCLSPASPIREVTMMFPAQSGKTFTADTVAMYYIECIPSEIIYATSDETMAMKWLEREIEPRATQAGIQFKSEVDAKTSRRTGNTSYSKSFPGGNIDIASARSPAQLASATKRIMLGDEVDRWQIKIGEQGTVINQLRARGQAWGTQQKVFWFSTPTIESASVINGLFLQGTQELYYVPCPYCGTMQIMDFEENRGFGLVWEHRSNRIYKKSIQLICENKACGRAISEPSKPKMLRHGDWRAQAVPEYEHMVSFNINGLYSFQLSWYDMVVAYEEAQKDPLKKQDFDQLKMGRPHRGSGTRPKVERLLDNRGKYKSGEVPPGVLYLTIGIDVQRGSANNPDNPPRLEMEVLGIGAQHRTWSIEYRKFEGDTSDPFSGAWHDITEYLRGKTYTRVSDGFQFPVSYIFIDSSDGERMDTVYKVAAEWEDAYPIKGQRSIQRFKGDKSRPDEMMESSSISWKRSRQGDIDIYIISTVLYKNTVYNRLKIERLPHDPQPGGFCDFPRDYSEHYFDMLTAEEKMADGSYDSHGRRNEALDCRVYALCAADVWLKTEIEKYRAYAIGQGFPCTVAGQYLRSKNDITKINSRAIIDTIIWATDKKGLYKHFEQVKNS